MFRKCAGILLAVTLLWGSLGMAGEVNPATIKLAKFEEQNPLRPKKMEPLLHYAEKYDFYDIDGMSTADLRRQMRENGTRWNDGKVYAALTTWSVDYRYEVKDENGRYYLDDISTNLDIVYHFPRRRDNVSASPELTGQWNAYMEHLKEHEFGHKDLAVKAARDINAALVSLGTFSSKRELEKEASRLIKEQLKRLNEVQVAYDSETHHGETQGAVLP